MGLLTDFDRGRCHTVVGFPRVSHFGLDLSLHFKLLLTQLHLGLFHFFVGLIGLVLVVDQIQGALD